MRTHHRTPGVISLSIVNVLCCAAGCVVFVWLLNLKDARQQAAANGSFAAAGEERDLARARVASLETELEARQARLDDALAAVGGLEKKLAAAEESVRRATADLEADRKRLADLTKEMASLREEKKSDADKVKNAEAVAGLEKKVALLENQVREKEALVDVSARQAKDLAEKLTEANNKLRLRPVTADSDGRFAGLSLNGKRVVFLVDTSGSMLRVDQDTASTQKWAEVRETVVKLLRSLPELEKFQVITFSEKATHLLGHEGAWLDFDPKTSPEQVGKALAAMTPDGGTDMHQALQAAFKLREQGLDTIYLLSDGLPNVGEALPADAKKLRESEKCEILSKHVRKTLKADWNRPLPNRARVRINTIGFFYESPDIGSFLWALARENDGGFVGMSKP